MRKITVALNFPDSVGEAITYARLIARRMAGNAYFPSPPVAIATLLVHIEELAAAEVVASRGAHGDAALRNVELDAVHRDLQQLKTYIETVANQHAEDGIAVVTSSGMSVKRSAGPKKALFNIKQQKRSGSVRAEVRHPGKDASFDWQYSVDGIHWIDAGRTNTARLDIDNLSPGTRYHFRVRALMGDVLGDWSDPIPLLVV
jgi:hypothetical protein